MLSALLKTSKRTVRLSDGLPVVGCTNGVYYVAFLYEDMTVIVSEFSGEDNELNRARAHQLYDTLRRAQGRK